ncbi:bacillithiol biosynthesis deacetylase BshB1 [Lacihabitans soyangensis]|uniref:Bacillithiol biosynthesis deacetylase BshB1 n=1 Tax=Lacihabitans soyangensis TaxID=869394 RepID=A0AAE3H8S8_9BACT|nr:bacillithiol biosynthesis deacetylase BshB1 [Lacihabitans soyangensis]MCP9765435.1 bacillithiol biosynthesis deacetylase BshB1 [Lacihabitans soyangensis]
MKLDILFFAAHPDDVEVVAGGIILKHLALGKKVGIIDFTCGELGTRGNAEIRIIEATMASSILGLSYRANLNFADCFFEVSKPNIMKVVECIRKHQPEIVITNPEIDRHPDHVRASKIVKEAVFISGLEKVTTLNEYGEKQIPWKPNSLLYYIQDTYIEPNLYFDITPFYETKVKAFKAYKSQFFDPESNEPETIISTPEFFRRVEARNIEFGRRIGVKYAEGLVREKAIGIHSLFDVI